MKKVWLIFKQDLKNIFTNGITFIAIIILLILPAVFTGFTIKASWAPANDGKNVKVAIINKDAGGTINNEQINIGNAVVELMKQDTELNWQFVTYNEAVRDVLTGKFYGMIEIPETFTEELISITTDAPVLPKVTYILNNRENAFTPILTEERSTNLQVHVAHTIVYAINEAAKESLGKFNIDFSIDNTQIRGVVEALLDLDENKELYVEKLGEYKAIVGNMMVLLSNLGNELPALSQEVQRSESLNEKAQRFMSIADELAQQYEQAGNKWSEINASDMNTLLAEFEKIAQFIKEEIPQLQLMVNNSQEIVRNVYRTFSETDRIIADITRDLHGLEDKLGFLAHDNDINKLVYILESNPELVKAAIAAPALVVKGELNALPNYGSALAPFNITVAMWMGTIILTLMLSTKFERKEPELDNEIEEIDYIATEHISPLQEYFGKGLFFVFLSCIQDIITIVVAKQVLGVYIANLGLFLLIGIVGSITFTAIIYTFVSVLGNTGKVITYMISVLQLFFLGGTVPTQVVPPIFQSMNKALPFIYVLGSFREVQVGFVTENLLKSGLVLLCCTLGAIICGVIGTAFLAPYIEDVRNRIRASHLGKRDY